ncbi:hypothetical protein [Amycolatopsis sp. TNS106]|uniref:hypothetical protein n=1 Tax=Amycolatopsis sp. TNS106 TaxID=2861750 RepID=UPI001C586BA6|nr:hypothetical protein [Amycolatopsis sp. TNS106]QXV56735.1 hypothetical protein CVV72_06750 [Amycolatopsis sp. TNS106]
MPRADITRTKQHAHDFALDRRHDLPAQAGGRTPEVGGDPVGQRERRRSAAGRFTYGIGIGYGADAARDPFTAP